MPMYERKCVYCKFWAMPSEGVHLQHRMRYEAHVKVESIIPGYVGGVPF